MTIILLFSCKENKIKNKTIDSLKKQYHLTGNKLNINPDKLNSTGKLILF